MNINNVPQDVISRDLKEIEDKTGNLYESIVIISRRSNQLSARRKEALHEKLSEFAPTSDSLEEIFENQEQIELSTRFEKLPKTTIVAIEEFLDDEVYFRVPEAEAEMEAPAAQ